MRLLATHALTACIAAASPNAKFDGEDLAIRDGRYSCRIAELLDPNAFYKTIHAIQRRGQDFYVVYGTSEMSRGWPPRGGHCGCGLESYIRWLHIKDGKLIEKQEGRFESCFSNRDGWAIRWRQGTLIWSAEGIEREGDSSIGKIVSVAFTWCFDPAHPEAGIAERKNPTEWQPERPKTEVVAPNGQ